MKSQLNWPHQTQESFVRPDRHSFWTQLHNTWQTVLAYFAASAEPHVWKSQDASGLPQWRAYDPLNRQTVEYGSETEMRAWLEERHYQYHRFTH